MAAAGLGVGLAAALGTDADCHGAHAPSDAARFARLEEEVAALSGQLREQFGVSATTGQGDAVFSWDQGLTRAFPDDARCARPPPAPVPPSGCLVGGRRRFEPDMHGGFNEDPDTGMVYTGIPGYGLCRISPDLKTWTRFGTDERLKGNIHGIVVFKHEGETAIAVAQNEDARVLIIGLDGTVQQELSMPKGGEVRPGARHSGAAPVGSCSPRAVQLCRGQPLLQRGAEEAVSLGHASRGPVRLHRRDLPRRQALRRHRILWAPRWRAADGGALMPARAQAPATLC